jgi:hypothetical protein
MLKALNVLNVSIQIYYNFCNPLLEFLRLQYHGASKNESVPGLSRLLRGPVVAVLCED